MKVFQPFAGIEDCFGAKASRYSYKVYVSEQGAQKAMPEFLERLQRKDKHDLGYAEKILGVSIIELELVE